MYFYFDKEHPYRAPAKNYLGIYKITSLDEYVKAREQLKGLKQLYEQMGLEKEEIDDEAMAVTDAIMEQEKQIDDYCKSIKVFDSKYLSSNIYHLLKLRAMKISDLETLLSVSVGYISRTIGVDSKKRISIDIIWMIAQVFRVNIDDLLNRDLAMPTKDLKTVVSFIEKLKSDTDSEVIHWNSLGNKLNRETDFLLKARENGKVVFAPNGEIDEWYNVKAIYKVDLNIGPIIFVELEDPFGDSCFRIFFLNEDDYISPIGNSNEMLPLTVMFDSGKEKSGLLSNECVKLSNAIITHERDFVISNVARNLIDQYLNPDNIKNQDDELPFC